MNHKLIWDEIAVLNGKKTAMLEELIDGLAHQQANYKIIRQNYAKESARIDAEIDELLKEVANGD